MKRPAVLAMSLILGCTASVFAADAKATLYLPFEDTTAPLISANTQKDFKKGKTLFEAGRVGKGARVQEVLEYANKNNISMEKGTICFFYAPDIAPKTEMDAYNKDKSKKPQLEFMFAAQHLKFFISGWSGCFMTGYYDEVKDASKKPQFHWSYALQSSRMYRWKEAKQFHHIAITWDQTQGGLRALYYDGEKAASVTDTKMPKDIAVYQSIEVGCKNMRGVMDEFIIYDQPLTVEQIKQHVTDPEGVAQTLKAQAGK